MAVIENDIQYNWVRKRVLKLKEKVDENTPSNNPYRIELELLSKLEKEYSEKYASVLESETIIGDVERMQINVYEGLPIILDKIKTVALADVIGKGSSWINNKHRHNIIKGKAQEFTKADLELINNGLLKLSNILASKIVSYSENRDATIDKIKTLSDYVSMPYIYGNVMNKTKGWYSMRMVHRTTDDKVSTFNENDICQINMAAMQIANELKSIELVL